MSIEAVIGTFEFRYVAPLIGRMLMPYFTRKQDGIDRGGKIVADGCVVGIYEDAGSKWGQGPSKRPSFDRPLNDATNRKANMTAACPIGFIQCFELERWF